MTSQNKLCPQSNSSSLTNGFRQNGFHEDKPTRDAFVNAANHSGEDQSTENDFCSLETDTNGLLTNFASLVNNYVQSLTDYKASKLEQFKQQVLKVGEAGQNCFGFLDLVDSLNGDDLNEKIKNFVNYKRKLENHLAKLARELKQEQERAKEFSQRSPVDLNSLNKLNLDSLNLNKLDDNDEDSGKSRGSFL